MIQQKQKTHRPIHEIAREIRQDWQKVNYGAKPYLEVMEFLTHKDEMYMYDRADNLIRYFLSNATSWKGETAKRIKKELKQLIK
jgi:hypothetical protein